MQNNSDIKIRIKPIVSTKKNAEVAGKLGTYVGKTANNMFILYVEGKTYNFFKKDLISANEHIPQSTAVVKNPLAQNIADKFINDLDPSISTDVINIICKRRTSRVNKSPRKSPRKSIKQNTCKHDEEISIKSGRCVQRCRSDQARNPLTNRCVKKKKDNKTFDQLYNQTQMLVSSSDSSDDDSSDYDPLPGDPLPIIPKKRIIRKTPLPVQVPDDKTDDDDVYQFANDVPSPAPLDDDDDGDDYQFANDVPEPAVLYEEDDDDDFANA